MKQIYVNLKRFDIPLIAGGVNSIADPKEWGSSIISSIKDGLKQYKEEAKFSIFLPEAHLINAVNALEGETILEVGCQGLHYADTSIGGNFGAFTSSRTGNSMTAIGCQCALIGHCEERKDKLFIMGENGSTKAVNQLLNMEIKAAVAAGLNVLYCIGESAEEQEVWQEVLEDQINVGLEGIDREKVVLAYEPVWAIGPGKVPPDKEYIEKIAKFVKERTDGMSIVYGGGLKKENAKMLSSINEIDGGLIALTRFQGEIGFYPEEYLEIVKTYLDK